MSDSFVQLNPDGVGKKMDIRTESTNGEGRQVMVIGDPSLNANVANVTVAGAVQTDSSAVTQPISAVSLPLPSGAATAVSQTNGTQQTQIVQGGNIANVDSSGDLQVDVNNPLKVNAANLCQSVTAATGIGVTVTLPAVVSQFHYITLIEIHKYFTVANAASATPLVVTTTNLPGALAFSFGQPLGTVGTTDERVYSPCSPLQSSVVNTATTIVCPATTGIIWRVNVFYYAAP